MSGGLVNRNPGTVVLLFQTEDRARRNLRGSPSIVQAQPKRSPAGRKKHRYAKKCKRGSQPGSPQEGPQLAKGNFGSRSNVWTVAKNTVEKGLTYAYRDRKNKKRNFRGLWIQRINAAVRANGMTYSEFMGKVNAKGIALNRKVLADLAMNHPTAFAEIIKTVK